MISNIEKKIRQIRELKGISQEFVATELNLSTRAYSKIESGETQLTINRLNDISEILEVSPQEILGFDEKFIFQNCQTAFGNNKNYYAFSEQERAQYESRVLHLEGEILFLRNQLETILKK